MPLKKKKNGDGKKKKGRRKKLTPTSRLNQQFSRLMKKEDLHCAYIERLNGWMQSNYGRAIDLFRKCSAATTQEPTRRTTTRDPAAQRPAQQRHGEASLSYGEFVAGMRAMDVPCTQIELYALAKSVDKDCDGRIDYEEFSAGLKYERPVKVVKKSKVPLLKIRREGTEKCPFCSVKLWSPAEQVTTKYICLEVKLLSLLQIRSYPGHFQVYVHSHMLVRGIIEMIKERHADTFTFISLYYENANSMRVEMSPDKSLEDIGFAGGLREEPQFLTLFYNFKAEMRDCPLLQCDHYFDASKLPSIKSAETLRGTLTMSTIGAARR